MAFCGIFDLIEFRCKDQYPIFRCTFSFSRSKCNFGGNYLADSFAKKKFRSDYLKLHLCFCPNKNVKQKGVQFEEF